MSEPSHQYQTDVVIGLGGTAGGLVLRAWFAHSAWPSSPTRSIIWRALSSRALHLRVGPGTRIPAHTSSMGIILLETLEPSQLAAFFKQWPRRRYTDRTPVEESEVRDLIQAAGRDGFCYLRGVMEDSIAGLSVPVRDRAKGRAIAALNVSTSLQRTSPEEALAKLLPELRAAAASIEAALR